MQRVIRKLLKPLATLDAPHGALPTLFAAVPAETQPGGYYGLDRMMEFKGHPVAVPVPRAAKDVATVALLWSETEKLVGTRFDMDLLR